VKDFHVDADEPTEDGKQCVMATLNLKIFPVTYTLQQTICEETQFTLCQIIEGLKPLEMFSISKLLKQLF
jgi:hypothetical protein